MTTFRLSNHVHLLKKATHGLIDSLDSLSSAFDCLTADLGALLAPCSFRVLFF